MNTVLTSAGDGGMSGSSCDTISDYSDCGGDVKKFKEEGRYSPGQALLGAPVIF
jgi:hypothetical protein